MADYTITGGRSSNYPVKHYGAQFTGSRATFCEPSDFASLSANVLAIPGIPVSVLTASPIAVPASFFGMTIQYRANDGMTDVTYKTVRSHDLNGGKGLWKYIQPIDSTDLATWDLSDLDSWVNAHYAAGRDIVIVLFGTPAWASARPTEDNAYSYNGAPLNRGLAAEPADMTDWDFYCTTLATRYFGKVKYWEIWNEPNYHNDGTGPGAYTDCFFTGTFAKLSEMVRRANQAIKAVDPTAKILCPAVQGWAAASNASDTYFASMLAASSGDGGSTPMKNWIDIVAVHLYLPSPNRTQDLPAIIDRIKASMSTAGISAKEIWDTESAPWQASTLTDTQFNRILSRMWATMAAKGIARTIYYQWDHGTMGINLRPNLISNMVSLRTLLMGGSMLNASVFTDGRVAYWTSAGVVII